MKMRRTPMPTFGHMWFKAIEFDPEIKKIAPSTFDFDYFTHPSQIDKEDTSISPFVRQSRLAESSEHAFRTIESLPLRSTPTRTRSLRISPHQLDKAAICPQCYLQMMNVGINSVTHLVSSSDNTQSAAEKTGLPPANVIGSIFHRVIEIGLQNPGLQSEISSPLPKQWVESSPNLLEDDALIQSVMDELLPADADREAMNSLLKKMSAAVNSGPLGILVSGNNWKGEIVEGLRTEWPFSLQYPIELRGMDEAWSPHGPLQLASIDRIDFSISGITDLVLCTRMDDGGGTIRAIDFKTTGAAHLYAGWPHPLLEAEGEQRHPSEQTMLEEYRMQLALYTLTLIRQEEARKRHNIPHRTVLPPAILCTATGRMIVMSEAEMQTAIADLESLLRTLGKFALEDTPSPDCDCPLNINNI